MHPRLLNLSVALLAMLLIEQLQAGRVLELSSSSPLPSDTVLVLIDVQLGFTRYVDKVQAFASYLPREHPESVMPNLLDFAQRWLEAGGSVVATQYVNPLDNSPLRHGYGSEWTRFTPGTELGDEQIRLDPRLQTVLKEAVPERVHVMTKTEYSCASAEFIALARQRNWTRFLLGGFNTDICVLYSLNGLFSLPFSLPTQPQLQPILLEDISSASGPIWHHNYAVEEVKSSFGAHRVRTTDAWCAETLAPGSLRPRTVPAVPPGPRMELEDLDGRRRSIDPADAMRMFGLAPNASCN